MKLFYSLPKRKPNDRKPSVLTVGNFDGIHLGHQAMIKKIVQDAKQHSYHPVIITFVNHPAQVIRPEKCPLKITPNEFRIKLFEDLGIEELYMLEFSKEFSGQTTLHFLEHLSETLHIKKIIMGHDAAIGKNREGDFAHLEKLGKKLHFSVVEFPPVSINGKIVSSTLIRQAIVSGDLSTAHQLLGRPYSVYGQVIAGAGKGKKLGFPTANLDITGLCIPPQGVYAVSVKLDSKVYKGIANLGSAPTVKNFGEVALEVHLFDFDKSLYHKSIEVIFERFIRPEMKFDSIESLKAQILQDIANTRTG